MDEAMQGPEVGTPSPLLVLACRVCCARTTLAALQQKCQSIYLASLLFLSLSTAKPVATRSRPFRLVTPKPQIGSLALDIQGNIMRA